MDSAPPAGADLIRVLAQALLDAADRLDQTTFATAVDLLSSVEGRVVLSGAGTSGMIARGSMPLVDRPFAKRELFGSPELAILC